jgi:hypothetical protein
MDQFIAQLALTLIGGAVGAAITLWVGWNQFRKQRWWDKRLEAYGAIFAAFHALLDEDAAYEDAEIENRKLSESEQTELRKKAKAGEAELWRQMRLSSLLISEPAEQALRRMFRHLQSAEGELDWVQFRHESSRALWDGLETVKRIAKNDLGVNGSCFWEPISG